MIIPIFFGGFGGAEPSDSMTYYGASLLFGFSIAIMFNISWLIGLVFGILALACAYIFIRTTLGIIRSGFSLIFKISAISAGFFSLWFNVPIINLVLTSSLIASLSYLIGAVGSSFLLWAIFSLFFDFDKK